VSLSTSDASTIIDIAITMSLPMANRFSPMTASSTATTKRHSSTNPTFQFACNARKRIVVFVVVSPLYWLPIGSTYSRRAESRSSLQLAGRSAVAMLGEPILGAAISSLFVSVDRCLSSRFASLAQRLGAASAAARVWLGRRHRSHVLRSTAVADDRRCTLPCATLCAASNNNNCRVSEQIEPNLQICGALNHIRSSIAVTPRSDAFCSFLQKKVQSSFPTVPSIVWFEAVAFVRCKCKSNCFTIHMSSSLFIKSRIDGSASE
jgi:hypothetical protein